MDEGKKYVEVVLPLNFGDGTYTYYVPSDVVTPIAKGSRVRVMFVKKELIGIVMSIHSNTPDYKVRPIIDVVDKEKPLLTESQLELIQFTADYYAESIGGIIKALLPNKMRTEGFSGNMIRAYRFAAKSLEEELDAREKKRGQYKALMAFALYGQNVISGKQMKKDGVSEKVLKDLQCAGILERVEVPRDGYSEILDVKTVESNLSFISSEKLMEQKPLVISQMQISQIQEFLSFLYIESSRKKEKTIVLMPSKDNRLVHFMEDHFEGVVTYFQSESEDKRARNYLRILNYPKSVCMIIGGRMLPLLPLSDVSNIVVIDEHDERFRGFRSPCFNGRDIAMVLAQRMNARLFFISPSPSFETMVSVYTGKYSYVEVKHSNLEIPKVLEKGHNLLSKYSRNRIENILGEGRNVLVYQNRRGYAGHISCPDCGYIPKCPRCSVSLTLHASSRMLKCHYCGYSEFYTGHCGSCGNEVVTTEGYGTERLASLLRSLYPSASVSILDSDWQEVAFDENGGHIIVGTSYMIRHSDLLQNIGLIVLANADNLLYGADFRVTEKAFRTVMALKMMAVENNAELIVQSRDFSQPVFKLLQDSDNSSLDDFYKGELKSRYEMSFPPYARLLRLEFRSIDQDNLYAVINQLHGDIRNCIPDLNISPVFEPEIDRINLEYILQIIIRFSRDKNGLLNKKKVIDILKYYSNLKSNKIKFTVEVDPT